jgi:uncharacterized protein (DUF1800 family)
MSLRRVFALCLAALLNPILVSSLLAFDPPPPVITGIHATDGQRNLRFTPYPGAQAYTFYSAASPAGPFTPDTNFFLAPYITGYTTIPTTNGSMVVTNYAYEWRTTNAAVPNAFYQIGVTPLSRDAVLTATVLNRLAYGPTPDELERVTAIGPQAYIEEQLNVEGIPENSHEYIAETTNAIPSDPTPAWTYISVTGRLSGTTFYLYLNQPTEVLIDDLELRPIFVTDGATSYGTNLLVNSDFESALTPAWTVSGTTAGSAITGASAHSGSGALRLVSSASGSTTANNIRQSLTTTLSNNAPVILSYWYLPSTSSSRLTVRLSGSGLISSAGNVPAPPTWIYATATGTATSTPQIYLYLSGAGEAYVDDLKLVAGSVPEAGPNLVQNGDFESPLDNTWTASRDFTNSTLSTTVARSGNSSLRLIATASGGGNNDSLQQIITPALVSGQTYTVSYWYLPSPNRTLTVRLSGSALSSTPDRTPAGLYRRLHAAEAPIADYRAWFCLHAVNSPRQLFEVLSQFWENHFVTQYAKSRDYLQGRGYDSTRAGVLATEWEFREMTKWRDVLLNPQGTFYDLLKISAESPAMIVYLDTVNSRGNGTRIANENYARELLELFTFGVDNGYDQNDIVLLSRAWTGWSVELVDAPDIDNPFALPSVTYYPNTNSTSKANTVGVWTFNFKSGNHGTNRGALFAGRTVPARFGPPWAGRNYQLTLPARTGTNGIMDGYDVIAHLADQPFTQEYLSIKLCRLFVHDDFPNPSTTPGQPEYDFYDYTNPNLPPEAALVHQCMLAWENSTPKGNLRAVLNTIFNSDLFRSHTAAAQKVKTPLEFVASSVRALRSVNADGTATASTDGFSFATPLNRMGAMALFDRGDPDGYPESGPPWISAGTLVERIRHAQAFCNAGTGDDAGSHVCDPVALLKKKLSSGSWSNAGAVADYFLGILYPGEGQANLALYRQAAMDFLNTADNGTTVSLFSSLGNTSTTYDTRVRSMVAMLMAFQRFQEQ